jgi:hypothetical protein
MRRSGEREIIVHYDFIAIPDADVPQAVEPTDAPQGVGRILGRDRNSAALVGRLAVGVATAMPDPDPATGLKHRIQCRGQAACRPGAADVLAAVNMDIGFTVGHHHQFGPAEARTGNLFQTFFCPGHGPLL